MATSGVNLVNAERVTKAYGTRVLLDAVSLGIADGDHVGVVGRNGGGKSTLLRVLTRREEADAGRVTHTGGLRIGWLDQGDTLDSAVTVRETVLGDRREHDWAGDAGTRGVLAALLGGLDLDCRVGVLSGGERRRVALAAMLVDDADLLVLDEPTNHLDVEAIDWLARHLASRSQAVVVVTHDRWFLDVVALRTWEVGDGRVHAYPGGYSAYVLARAERTRVAATDEARRANLLRKELAWLRRGPPARTRKPQFRIDAATALIADEPPARDRLELARFASARLGRTVLELTDVTVARGGRVLLDRLTWQLGPGDRVGLVGANGAGKTTLLRLLTQEVAPDSGRLRAGSTVRVAHLSQDVVELDPDQRALDAVAEVRRTVRVDGARGPKGALGRSVVADNARTQTAAQLMERFGFTGDRPATRVRDLSGGERRRLQLLRLLVDEPNVLLLDEPTNDLDIETLTVLEDLLDSWAGSLVVVSHDRWFLERVTDTVAALLGDGRLRELPGGVEEYLRRRRELPAPGWPAVSPAPTSVPTPGPPASATAATSPPTSGAPASAAGNRTARKEMARLERELDRLAAREATLHDDLAAHATDHERVLGLDADLRALRTQRDEVEERWLAIADEA